MGIKLTKEEALAYVQKIEHENEVLKNRCHVMCGGVTCGFCMIDCKYKKGQPNGEG